MKISFFKNDKKTALDELVLFLVVAVCLTAGILLMIHRPSFWFVDSTYSALAGVLLTILGVMYTPCLIYRLFTNER